MSTVKKWSTGAIGNTWPDHSDRGNPNTQGLDTENRPGVEAYIEEDAVVASDDNRPIKNLVDNDVVLENNLSDVASEVDKGVFLDRYNDFDIEILPPESVKNPENNDQTILITPLRIRSGSSIIDGQVTRIGNQQLIYFVRKDDEDSILFPPYEDQGDALQIEITDEDYFGDYEPVYSTISDDLPENFDSYIITITNIDTTGTQPNRVLNYDTYRDWEDIIPLPAETLDQEDEVVSFQHDQNYGQFSEGYRVYSGGVVSTQISNVQVEKKLTVKDDLFVSSDFVHHSGPNEHRAPIHTNYLFFDDVILSGLENLFDRNDDINDIHVDENENIYFTVRDTVNKYLYLKASTAQRIQAKLVIPSGDAEILTGIRVVGNNMFLIGTEGFLKVWNTNTDFLSGPILSVPNFSTTQDIQCICVWDNKIWVTGETSVWYTNDSIENFDPSTTTFTEIDLTNEVTDISGGLVVDKTTRLLPVNGLYTQFDDGVADDSRHSHQITNYVRNSSFEEGGLNNTPLEWTLNDPPSGQFIINSHPGDDSISTPGNFVGVLTKTGAIQELSADQVYDDLEINVGDRYTFSFYITAQSATQSDIQSGLVKAYIEELDDSDTVLDSHSTSSNIMGTHQSYLGYSFTGWRIFTHKRISNENTTKLRVRIATELTTPVVVDSAQLEVSHSGITHDDDTSNPGYYVENFEYLLVGFKKIESNEDDPPFFFIDSRDKYNIKYDNGKYGHIKSMNDAYYNGENSILFVDDQHVYDLTLLNERDEYDRYTIVDICDDNCFDFETKIEKFETIHKFGDKIYFGGTIKNEVISAEYQLDNEEHTISFEDVFGEESLKTLLGNVNVLQPVTTNDMLSFEFERNVNCIEGDSTEFGSYLPGAAYHTTIYIDGEEHATVTIIAPEQNEGPWTLANIYSQIASSYSTTGMTALQWRDPSGPSSPAGLDWRRPVSASDKLDGFYSFGENNLTSHIRGNIHRMFTREGDDDHFYIIRGSQIFKSKFDPNILKTEAGTYQSYDPDLDSANHNLQEFRDIRNSSLYFSDDPYNRSWVDIPVSPGYDLQKRSLRVKTNQYSQVGFSEGIDYEVDYDNKKIIRKEGRNFLTNPTFEQHTSQVPNGWNFFVEGNVADSEFRTYSEQYDDFTDWSAQVFVKQLGTDQLGIVHQSFEPPTGLAIGHTYTFSVYVKSNKSGLSGVIRLTELAAGDESNFALTTYSESPWNITADQEGEFTRFEVTHTVTTPTADKLRVEFHTNDFYETRIALAQLERNPQATTWMMGEHLSRINPDSTVIVDFTEFKSLNHGTEYTFDTSSREIAITNAAMNSDSRYYLEFKYNKIFNAFDFGTSIPRTQVTNYNSNDDYFLYLNEGRIWAINQMFSMLSLDETDPLLISYQYHYPRVDAIKIRNTPDKYGNHVYIVKGADSEESPDNPYKPNDPGAGFGIDGETQRYYYGVDISQIQNTVDNDTLYEINIVSNEYTKNDIYDRRIYIDARYNTNFNISLYPETVAYFPFQKDFNSTNGLAPLNFIQNSKIIPIIKYYSIIQFEEVGAWHDGYQIQLRTRISSPSPSNSIYVDPINGIDSANGQTIASAVRTVQAAVDRIFYNSQNDRRNNIVILGAVSISENIEIDKPFTVGLFAETYCYWQGAIRNLTPLNIQGIWFRNSELYPFNDLNLYYTTLENTSINCSSPQNVGIYNTEAVRCHNSIIRVNDTLFPTPFGHPYLRHPERDDGVVGNPQSVATSDTESIHPGDDYVITPNLTGAYNFENCLIYDSTDHIVEFDPSVPETGADYSSTFTFSHCTLANNRNLFSSTRSGLSVLYINSILSGNREERGSDSKIFDTNSNIEFDTCFIDFPAGDDPSNWNYLTGSLIGRDTCIGLGEETPGFISIQDDDYHLKSIARGSDSDAITLNAANNGIDLGCYNESREQTEKDIPKKLRNYVGFIDEGIIYPITLNSEKITVTLEFKPTGAANQSGVLLDTRSAGDDEDYIVLLYNNNDDDDHSIESNQLDPNAPFRFRVLVKNRNTSYSIISPIDIYTDEDFKVWHKISFTVNYEKIYNLKSGYSEHDKQQNIITLYHNEATSIESFIKYDLNRDKGGDLLTGRGDEGTNAWNFNNICQFITVGSDYSGGQNKMQGYYSELRIDNRFIDRKEFDLWNHKEVPFNDPLSYVNQAPLTKSFDTRTLTEYWSLKDKYGVGAKGNVFKEGSNHREIYENGELSWYLGKPTDNLINNSGFIGIHNAQITSDSEINFDSPIEFFYDWIISTTGSRINSDNTGITLDVTNPNVPGWEGQGGYQELGLSGIDGSTASGLTDGESYSYNISIDNGPFNEFTIDVPAAGRGYQELGLMGKNSSSDSGLVENTTYYYNIDVDASGSQEFSITIGGSKEKFTAKFPGDVSGSYQNKYWYLNSGLNETLYYVWYNVGGSGTDPSPDSLRQGIEVAINSDDNSDAIISATRSAIDGHATAQNDFTTSVVSGVSEITDITVNQPNPIGFGGKSFLINAADGFGGQNEYYVWYDFNNSSSDPGATNPEITTFNFHTSVSYSDSGKYFTLYSAENSTTYLIWFSMYGSYGSAPSTPNGETAIKVSFYSSDRGHVAQQTVQTINSLPDFNVTNYTSYPDTTFDVVNTSTGYANNAVNNSCTNFIYLETAQEGGPFPGLEGKTGIQIDLLPTDGIDDIASKTAIAINGDSAFNASSNSGVATIESSIAGFVTPTSNYDLGPLISISRAQQGVEPYLTVEAVVAGETIDPVDINSSVDITIEKDGNQPDTTWGNIVDLLSDSTIGASWVIESGDIRALSDTSGASSSISLGSGTTGIPEITDVFLPGDENYSLSSKAWMFNTAGDANNYMVWYKMNLPAEPASHEGTNGLSSGYDFSSDNRDFLIAYGGGSAQSVSLTTNETSDTDIVNRINTIFAGLATPIDANVEAYEAGAGRIGIRTTVTGSAETFNLISGSNDALTLFGMAAGTYVGTDAHWSPDPANPGGAFEIDVALALDDNAIDVVNKTTTALSSLPGFSVDSDDGRAAQYRIETSVTDYDFVNLNGKYFSVFTPDEKGGEDEHYFWIDNGTAPEATLTFANDSGGNYGENGVYWDYWTRRGSGTNQIRVMYNVPLSERTTLTFTGLNGLDLQESSGFMTVGRYFTISSPGTDYYVWFNVSNGSSDPGISGMTGIEVAVGSAFNAALIAQAVKDTLDGHADFTATNINESAYVETVAPGDITDATTGNIPGMSVNVSRQGRASSNHSGDTGVADVDVVIDLLEDEAGLSIAQKTVTQLEAAAPGEFIFTPDPPTTPVVTIQAHPKFSGNQAMIQSPVGTTDIVNYEHTTLGREHSFHPAIEKTWVRIEVNQVPSSGSYFILQTTGNDAEYFWFNIDGGSTDPGSAGSGSSIDSTTMTGNEIAISSSDSLAAIRTQISTVIGSSSQETTTNGTIDRVSIEENNLMIWVNPYDQVDTIETLTDGTGAWSTNLVYNVYSNTNYDSSLSGKIGHSVELFDETQNVTDIRLTNAITNAIALITDLDSINVADNVVIIRNISEGAVSATSIGTISSSVMSTSEVIPGNDPYIRITNSGPGPATSATDINAGAVISVRQQGSLVSDLFSSIPDFSAFEAPVQGTATTGGVWSEIIPLLTAATTDATWSIVDGDIRCTSELISNQSSIEISNGTTGNDLLASITGFTATEPPQMGYEKVVVNSYNDLSNVIGYMIDQNPGTKIDFRIDNQRRVQFFTRDNVATQIQATFGADASHSDHEAMNFSDWNVTGSPSLGTWNILGLVAANSNDDVYFTNEEKYTRFTEKSLIIDKKDTSSPITVYSNAINMVTGVAHYYTVYVYNEGKPFDSDEVRFYINGSDQEWDEIEKSFDSWYIFKKLFYPTVSPTEVGITFLDAAQYTISIDGVQLERSSYPTPYVEDATANNGALIASSSLINKSRGVVHFRFRPYFEFDEPKAPGVDSSHPPRILFESLGIDNNTQLVEEDRGFRCQYYFDENRNRGVVEFTINGSAAKWELETVETFWHQWHTLAIVYDFSTDRYVFWFDYFSNVIDSNLNNDNFTYTDLYIGRGYPLSTRPYSEYSADIAVKDVIITDFPINDVEIRNWVQTYEFFSMSQVVTTMNALERNLEKITTDLDDISSGDIITRLNSAEDDISALQDGQLIQNNDLANHANDITDHENRVSSIETMVGSESPREGILGDILDISDDISEIRGTGWPPTNNTRANLTDIRDDIDSNNNLINDEVINRAAADQAIRDDLASNANGLGASLVGIEDVDGMFTTTNVEAALAEIAGVGRTNETIYGNATQIATNSADIATNLSNIDILLQVFENLSDAETGLWTLDLAQNDGYNVYDIKQELINISTSTTDGSSGADHIAATSIAPGTAETVQGILEELDGRIAVASSGSLDVAYDNGSIIAVDDTDVDWQLSFGSFRISDSTDANKFVVTEGTASTSVEINTSGGVTINAALASNLNFGGNSSITVENDFNLGSTNGVLSLSAGSYIETDNNVLPAITEQFDIGSALAKYKSIYAQEAYFDAGTVNIGTGQIRFNTEDQVLEFSNNSGATYSRFGVDQGLTAELGVNSTAWQSGSGDYADYYYADLNHKLETTNIVTMVRDANNNTVIGVHEVERVDENNIRIYVNDNTLNLNVSIFGVKEKYSVVVNNWTPDGTGSYYRDVTHPFNTTNIMVSAFDIETGEQAGMEDIVVLNPNTIRVKSGSVNDYVNVYITHRPELTVIKDIDGWIPDGNDYKAELELGYGFDAVYNFFDVSSGLTIGVDSLRIEGSKTIIRKSDNSLVRMIVLR